MPATTDVYNTLYYTAFTVPASVALSLGIAMLLSKNVRGIAVYRTIFFLPSIVPIVASALFMFLFQWGDFLNPLIYLQDDRQYTLAIALQQFQSQHESAWGAADGDVDGDHDSHHRVVFPDAANVYTGDCADGPQRLTGP